MNDKEAIAKLRSLLFNPQLEFGETTDDRMAEVFRIVARQIAESNTATPEERLIGAQFATAAIRLDLNKESDG